MAVPGRPGPVVVAVPDSGVDALIPLAVSRAREYGAAIDLVRVWRTIDRLLTVPAADAPALTVDEKHDQALLDRAVRRVHKLAPDIAVLVDFAPGDLYNQLLDRTRGASLLVLGNDIGQDASIAAWYLERAFCPVVVVDLRGRVIAEGPTSRHLARYGPHGS
jgi:hypothetical protein